MPINARLKCVFMKLFQKRFLLTSELSSKDKVNREFDLSETAAPSSDTKKLESRRSCLGEISRFECLLP